MARECWAAGLGGCSNKLSGEHVVSKSVLKAVYEYDNRLSLVRGREGTQMRPISIANATVKNLCTTHNNRLRALDDEALRFTKAVLRAMTPAHAAAVIERRVPPAYEQFDGLRLERWAIKTFLNMCAAQDNSDAFLAKNRAPLGGPQLAEIVFNGAAIPPGQGVFFLFRPEPRVHRFPNPVPFEVQIVEATKTRPHPIFYGVFDPEIRCPMYMVLSIGPLQFAVCSNITKLDQAEWQRLNQGFTQSGKNPRGYFHTPMICLEWHNERAVANANLGEHVRPWGEDHLYKGTEYEPGAPTIDGALILVMKLNWPPPPFGPPASIVMNRWIGYNSSAARTT
jgi:hypothetical protein